MDRFFVPKPCSEDASKMARTPSGFYCDSCEHSVIDATRMTRAAFLRVAEDARESGARVCARVRKGENGEASFRAPPPPARVPRRRFAGGLVLLSALTTGGCGVSGVEPATPPSATAQPLELSTLTPAETTVTPAPPEPTTQPPAARVDPEEFMLGEIEHVPAPPHSPDPQP